MEKDFKIDIICIGIAYLANFGGIFWFWGTF